MPTPQELTKRMRTLEEKIQTLEDLEAIKQLKARYALLADQRYGKRQRDLNVLAGEMAKLFTEDAVWDGGERGIYHGRKELYEHFRKPRQSFTAHYFILRHMSNERDKAHGSWLLWMPATSLNNTAFWMAGQENEDYIKIKSQWLISRLKLALFFETPYDQGWVKSKTMS